MILYSKFNNTRKIKYQLITKIEETNNRIFSSKISIYPESAEFLNSINDKYQYLINNNFSFKPIKPTKIKHNKIQFEYQNTKTLEYILHQQLINKNKSQFKDTINNYIQEIKNNKIQKKFLTNKFYKIFSPKSSAQKKVELLDVGCIDLNFNNIFTEDKKNEYHLIDYEWTFNFPIPYKYIVFRAITDFYSRYSQYKPNDLVSLKSLYKNTNITLAEEKEYINYEYNFQKYVNNNEFATNTNKNNFYANYQALKHNVKPYKYFTKLSNYESENQTLTKQINEINQIVSNYESENQNLSKQIEQVNQKIATHQNNLNALTTSKYYKTWRLYCKFKDLIKK